MAALLSPSTLLGETNALHKFVNRQGDLPQISVEMLIGSQANYEIKIMIYFYKIMISYETYSTLNLY